MEEVDKWILQQKPDQPWNRPEHVGKGDIWKRFQTGATVNIVVRPKRKRTTNKTKSNSISASPKGCIKKATPFQRNLNGSIAVPSTAMEVYDRLGLRNNASKRMTRFLRSRNRTLQSNESIAEVTASHRCRLIKSVTPALKTVLSAFVGKGRWRELLFWAANNVKLHDNEWSTQLWRDKVYTAVLKNSTFVQNIVTRFNALVEYNDRSARRERRRILSEIGLDFSYDIIRDLGFRLPVLPKQRRLHGDNAPPRPVSTKIFHEARNHARAFGPGGKGFEIPHVKEVNFTIDQVLAVLSYINNDVHIQQLACGTKPVVLSTGDKLEVGSVSRKMLRAHLWSRYVAKHTVEGRYVGDLSKKKFMKTLETATDSDQQTYAALDQIKVRCGSENFESGLRLLKDICSRSDEFRSFEKRCIKDLTRYKEHCKSGLPTHLQLTSTTAAHCLKHMLGGQVCMYGCTYVYIDFFCH
jgi:hypothetical protein